MGLCWDLCRDDSINVYVRLCVLIMTQIFQTYNKRIINPLYLHHLVYFFSTRFLLRKFVFSRYFYYEVWRRSLRPAGRGNASLPLIGCFNHVTDSSSRPPHLERSLLALPGPHQAVTQPVSGVPSHSTEVRIGKTKTPSNSLRINCHESGLFNL